jgi:MoaA/NifB/PqqE/SkfB family radical SAM enzyme
MNKFINIEDIKVVEFELTSMCNASCVGCIRHTSDTERKIYSNKAIEKQSIEFDLLVHIFDTLPNMRTISCVGTISDPLMYTRFLDLMKMVHERNIGSHVHTNGSLRRKEIWAELGRMSQSKKNNMVFSIDGLEDTNWIYRRGTNWDKIMENARAYIAAGGYATWKFIRFDHNEHQIEKARQRATDMGFSEFIVNRNLTPHLGDVRAYTKVKEPIPSVDQEGPLRLDGWWQSRYKDTCIKCKAQEKGNIFIDYTGEVFPCCWVANHKYHHKQHYKKMLEKYGIQSLYEYSLRDILNNQFYGNDLVESWSRNVDNEDPPMRACLQTCTKPRDVTQQWHNLKD